MIYYTQRTTKAVLHMHSRSATVKRLAYYCRWRGHGPHSSLWYCQRSCAMAAAAMVYGMLRIVCSFFLVMTLSFFLSSFPPFLLSVQVIINLA